MINPLANLAFLSGTVFACCAIGHAVRSLFAKDLDETERNFNRAIGFGAFEFVFMAAAAALSWFQL